MKEAIYLQTGSQNPAFNLAFEEYILTHRREGAYLILWQNDNAVIVGRNQNTVGEINGDFVRKHGIRVVRRGTGGGAVYHDLGNLNYSFITDAQDAASIQRFLAPVVTALRALGLDAECSGRNDILIRGKKVSGSAQQLREGRILHHGTLLFDSDTSILSGALNPDPTKFHGKGVASVKSRVGNIRDFLPQDMTLPQFWAYLKDALADSVTDGHLTAEELAAIAKLKAEKYDTWQWNFGRSPAYQQLCHNRFPAGLLEVHLTADKGRIAGVSIYGDFLSLSPVAPLERALIGCELRREAVSQRLHGLPLKEILGGITVQQFLETLFS